ncbi:hypothetical protein KUCAC02_017239, partial [Chaenocephalus aceratus]
INLGKLCLRCTQSGLYRDEMHLPRNKAEGAVEDSEETMMSKARMKTLMLNNPLPC